jgi:hypothetical protein
LAAYSRRDKLSGLFTIINRQYIRQQIWILEASLNMNDARVKTFIKMISRPGMGS